MSTSIYCVALTLARAYRLSTQINFRIRVLSVTNICLFFYVRMFVFRWYFLQILRILLNSVLTSPSFKRHSSKRLFDSYGVLKPFSFWSWLLYFFVLTLWVIYCSMKSSIDKLKMTDEKRVNRTKNR